MITCRADGFPHPKVIWKRAIDELSSEYHEFSIKMNGNDGDAGGGAGNSATAAASASRGIDVFTNGTLSIRKITKDNEGSFMCQASNGIGAGLSKLIFLKVHGKHQSTQTII